MEREQIVAGVISAAGGSMTGRVRLQKTVYLLDQLNLGSGFGYEYHYYGPYSADLTAATADAKAFGLIDEQIEYRRSDGAQFSIFELRDNRETLVADAFGLLGKANAQRCIAVMNRYSATALELAATIDWLWRYERRSDWQREIQRRKGLKTAEGRLEKAIELLQEIGLHPPANS